MGKFAKNLLTIIVVVGIAYATHWFSWINGPINAAGGWLARESGGPIAWVGGWFGHGGERRLGAAEIVARTEPAVYRVISGGNIELISPTAILLTPGNAASSGGGVDGLYGYVPPLVVQQYQTARAAGTTLGEGRGEYCWNLLLSDPRQYLQYSGEGSVTVEARGVPFGTATAFAVSPAGILVTNAHVVANGNITASVGGAAEAQSLLQYCIEHGPLTASLQAIQKGIGSPCPANLQMSLSIELMRFLLVKSHLRAPFTRVVVMLNYRPDAVPQGNPFFLGNNPFLLKNAGSIKSILKESVASDINQPQSPQWATLKSYLYSPGSKFVGYYAKVLTKGSPYPGKDVAILQLDNPKIGASLICLPLADSNNFALGSQVRCFGFPAVAVQKQIMRTSAKYQVTAMDATIDSVEATRFGWSAFHMESFINEGDSGGPEIDRYGRVVAINDAGRLGTGQDWSVPINLVKTFVEKVGVKPQVGRLSILWFKGQKLFWQKHYRRAEAVFYRVLKMQCGEELRPSSKYGTIKVTAAAGKMVNISSGSPIKPAGGNLLMMNNPLSILEPSTTSDSNAPPLANWYVLAAVADCQRQLQKR